MMHKRTTILFVFSLLLVIVWENQLPAQANQQNNINYQRQPNYDENRRKPKDEAKKLYNEMLRKVYNMNDINDLASLGIDISSSFSTHHAPASMVMGRVGGGGPSILKSSASVSLSSSSEEVKDATPGKCDPKPVCISNPLTADLSPNQLSFPQCITIHRCDGCCPSNEECFPIEKHDVQLAKVGIITLDQQQGRAPSYSGKLVSVSNHTECQCQCKWKSDADCQKVNKNHVKSFYECACECPDDARTKSCDAFHEFDPDECMCKCKKRVFGRLEANCERKGYTWNDADCRCQVSRMNTYHREISILNRN